MHDTVGIIYQTVLKNRKSSEGTSEQLQNRSEDGECTGEPSVPCVHPGHKRKRTFDAIIPELQSYLKKPGWMMNYCLYPTILGTKQH